MIFRIIFYNVQVVRTSAKLLFWVHFIIRTNLTKIVWLEKTLKYFFYNFS